MNELTILERIKSFINIIYTSPFFIFLFSFIVLTIITFTVYNATKSKLSKILLTISYALVLIYLFIEYGVLIYKYFNLFIERLFSVLYFQNLFTYICITLVTSVFMLLTIKNKKVKKFIRICTLLTLMATQLLFILSISISIKSNVMLFNKIIFNSNQVLMTLVQTSMLVLSCFIGLHIINLVLNLLNINKSKVLI